MRTLRRREGQARDTPRGQRFKQVAYLPMRDHEWCRHNLKPEDAVLGGLLDIFTQQGVHTILTKCFLDLLQHLDDVCPGATAGVEYINILISKAIGNVELGPERNIDTLDHVLDDFKRRVPDAHLFAEVWIEGFQEGLVKMLNSMLGSETLEELDRVDAVQGFAGTIENIV